MITEMSFKRNSLTAITIWLESGFHSAVMLVPNFSNDLESLWWYTIGTQGCNFKLNTFMNVYL